MTRDDYRRWTAHHRRDHDEGGGGKEEEDAGEGGLFEDARPKDGGQGDTATMLRSSLATHGGEDDDFMFDHRVAYVPSPADAMPSSARFVGASVLPVAFDPTFHLPFLMLGKTYRQWSLIGGHVRPGETPEETASREFWEETMGWVASDHMETLPLATHAELLHLLRARNYVMHMISTDAQGRSYVLFVRQVPFDAAAESRFADVRREACAQHEAYGRMVQEARQRTRFVPPPRRSSPSSPSSSSSSPPSPSLRFMDTSWARKAPPPPREAEERERIHHIETAEGKVPHKFLELRGVRWFSLPQIERELEMIAADRGDLSKGKRRPWTLDRTCSGVLTRCVEELKMMMRAPPSCS